jgi:hypothetical protein
MGSGQTTEIQEGRQRPDQTKHNSFCFLSQRATNSLLTRGELKRNRITGYKAKARFSKTSFFLL